MMTRAVRPIYWDRRMLDFSGSDHDGGLVRATGIMQRDRVVVSDRRMRTILIVVSTANPPTFRAHPQGS